MTTKKQLREDLDRALRLNKSHSARNGSLHDDLYDREQRITELEADLNAEKARYGDLENERNNDLAYIDYLETELAIRRRFLDDLEELQGSVLYKFKKYWHAEDDPEPNGWDFDGAHRAAELKRADTLLQDMGSKDGL